MSQPHHYVFNAIQRQINACVPIEDIYPFIVEKAVITEEEQAMISGAGRSGMPILTGILRNRDFQTFLVFIECICMACYGPNPSKKVDSRILGSTKEILVTFDSRHGSSYSAQFTSILEQYQEPAVLLGGEVEQVSSMMSEMTVETTMNQGWQEQGHCLQLPQLQYVTSPETIAFTSQPCRYYNSDWELIISVPAKAVPEGQVINMSIGACCYGPFHIQHKYQIVSGFFCITTDSNFVKEVTVQMEHCLLLPEYSKDRSVVVLKADHQTVTKQGLFIFSAFVNPDILDSSPHLSFKMKSFCILCGALESDTPQTSVPSNPANDDSSSISSVSSLQCKESRQRGLKRTHSATDCNIVKRQRKLEYCILVYEPSLDRRMAPYEIIMFVCRNCSTSIHECGKQAKRRLSSSQDLSLICYECFEFESSSISLSLPDTSVNGWRVTPRMSMAVSEDDVNIYSGPLDEVQVCDLKGRVASLVYPPRRVMEVSCEESNGSLSLKVPINGTVLGPSIPNPFFTIRASANQHEGSSPVSPYSVPHCESVDIDAHFSPHQMNQNIREGHLAMAALYINNKDNLCQALQCSRLDINRIKYELNPKQCTEFYYQVLYLSFKRRQIVTIRDLAKILSLSGESEAITNLAKYCER